MEGEGSPTALSLLGKCCTEHRAQWSKFASGSTGSAYVDCEIRSTEQRVVTEQKTWSLCTKVFAHCHMGPMNLYTKFCLLNWSHMWWSAIGTSLGWHSVHSLIMSALLNEDSDMVICGQSIDWLSVCHHMTIMWLFGPIRAWLTFCGNPHVSVSSSSMLITVNGRCWCLQIWIQEFAILKQPITAQLAILPPPYLWLSEWSPATYFSSLVSAAFTSCSNRRHYTATCSSQAELSTVLTLQVDLSVTLTSKAALAKRL